MGTEVVSLSGTLIKARVKSVGVKAKLKTLHETAELATMEDNVTLAKVLEKRQEEVEAWKTIKSLS